MDQNGLKWTKSSVTSPFFFSNFLIILNIQKINIYLVLYINFLISYVSIFIGLEDVFSINGKN